LLIDRLSWAATAATVAVMFISVVWLQPMLRTLPPAYGIASAVAGAAASLGVYRLLSTAFLWLFSKGRWLRKLILGKGFIEGTWVGHYKHNDEHFITVEFIEQASGQTRINGREFDATG
jgi:hypothetical protein